LATEAQRHRGGHRRGGLLGCVAQHDVFAAHHLAYVVHDPRRRQWERRIRSALFPLRLEEILHRRHADGERVHLRGVGDRVERFADRTLEPNLERVVRVDLGDGAVDVHDLLVPRRVPAPGRVLDDVVADGDHNVGPADARRLQRGRLGPIALQHHRAEPLGVNSRFLRVFLDEQNLVPLVHQSLGKVISHLAATHYDDVHTTLQRK